MGKIYLAQKTQALALLLESSSVNCQRAFKEVLAGANPNVRNKINGDTLLHMVIREEYFFFIPELLVHGADVNAKNNQGKTPVEEFVANSLRDFSWPLMLMLRGADPNVRLAHNNTWLHRCVKDFNFDYIDHFIAAGVDPTLTNDQGETALGLLLYWTHRKLDAVRLICAGADINTRNSNNESMIDLCNGDLENLFQHVAKEEPELLLRLQRANFVSTNPAALVKTMLENNHFELAVNYLAIQDINAVVNNKDENIVEIMLQQKPDILFSVLAMDYDPSIVIEGQKTLVQQVLANTCSLEMEEKIQLALACMQRGADIHTVNEDNQNILQIICQQYPEMEDELESYRTDLFTEVRPEDVFNELTIADFRLQLKYRSVVHQLQNTVLNFFILLVCNRMQPAAKQSIFSILPDELIIHIISFLPLSESKRSLNDVVSLFMFMLDNAFDIRTMLKTPGGVNVLQANTQFGREFTFFKSAENLSWYYKMREKSEIAWLKRESEPVSDLEKQAHAVNCWVDHLSLFRNQLARLTLLERLDGIFVYKDLEEKQQCSILRKT